MWSGKSSALLAAIDRYRHQGRPVLVFKPRIDDRYAHDSIVTHGGWRTSAVPVRTGLDIVDAVLAAATEPHAVAVDELFMIPGGGTALIEVFRSGISVAVSTLDLSASGAAFPEVQTVLPWATRVEKLTAVCAACRGDARYTMKRTGPSLLPAEIEVGGAETYEPRCLGCHPFIKSADERATDKEA
jgi:thymidine kinase